MLYNDLMKKFLCLTISLGALIYFSFVEAASTVTITNPIKATSFQQLITNMTSAISLLVGSIGVIMLIIAGIYFLISAGEPQKLQKAKDFAVWAIIGIVIALTASAIVALIKAILGI